MLRIVTYPHPALRYESVPVRQIDDRLRAYVREMFDLMYEHRGIGLAANQVALPLRFFVMNLTCDPDKPDQERVFLNPTIVKRHSSIQADEGCLSFPALYGEVQRAKRVRVKAFDLQGQEVDIEANDLLSRAIQHETDHLDGRLFIDHFDPETRREAEPKLRLIENDFRQLQSRGEFPPDDEISRQLRELAALG